MTTLEQRIAAHRRRRLYDRQVAAGIHVDRRRPRPFNPALIRTEAIRLAATLTPDDPDELAYRHFVLDHLHEDLDDRLWGDNTKENA